MCKKKLGKKAYNLLLRYATDINSNLARIAVSFNGLQWPTHTQKNSKLSQCLRQQVGMWQVSHSEDCHWLWIKMHSVLLTDSLTALPSPL